MFGGGLFGAGEPAGGGQEDRAMLLARHAAAVQACYGLQKFKVQMTAPVFADASYEASRREVNAGISKLRPIWRIADLRLAVHRSNYIIVRTISEPVKMTALSFVVEDVQGAATRLSIYELTEETRFVRLCQLFPEGTIWLVKAPFFKLAADGGRVIRVENPSNINRLAPSDPLLAETPWYQPAPAPSAGASAAGSAAAAGAGAAGASAAAAEAPDAESLRVQGNEHFKRGQLEEAMARYRAAVAADPSDHLSWGNMAQVELQQADRARERAKYEAARAHYAAAVEHARMSVVIKPTFVKSAVRHARALMGLGRYAVAHALVDEQMLRLDAPREGPVDVKDHDAVAAVHAELADRLGVPRSGLESFAFALSKLPPTAGTGGAPGAAAAGSAAGARKAPAAGAAAAAAASNACEPADSFPAEMAEELRQRGNAQYRRGAFAAAAAAYRGALGHLPAHPITCSNLAECELKLADAACATAASQAKGGSGGEAAGGDVTAATGAAAAAASPTAQRHFAVALACADMALAGAPDHAKSAHRRARALLGLGRSEEAAAQLRAGLAMLSSAAGGAASAAPPPGSAELGSVMRHLLSTLQPADAACLEPAGAGAIAETTAAASASTAARTAPAASAARASTAAAARSRAARGARSSVAEFAEDEEDKELPRLAASASSAAAAALQTCEDGPGTLNVAETPDSCGAAAAAAGSNSSEVSEGYTTNAPEVAEGYHTNAPETSEPAVHTAEGV